MDQDQNRTPEGVLQPTIQVVVNQQQPISPYLPPPPIIPKQRLTFVLLGVFLGMFGVHNFYAGYQGKAGCQLCITLFLGWLIVPLLAVYVWVLLELLFVTEDERGVRMV